MREQKLYTNISKFPCGLPWSELNHYTCKGSLITKLKRNNKYTGKKIHFNEKCIFQSSVLTRYLKIKNKNKNKNMLADNAVYPVCTRVNC